MPKTLIVEKLDRLNDRVWQVVMADGVVSEDEKYILEKTKISIELLKQVVDHSPEEDLRKGILGNIIDKIEDDALSAAEFDDYISEDEMGILGVLFDSLKELNDVTQ